MRSLAWRALLWVPAFRTLNLYKRKQKRPLATNRKWPLSGGGGNRTRVPWHFGARFYVCILSMLDGFPATFALPDSDKQDAESAIEQVV